MKKFLKKKGNKVYSFSFEEGNKNNTLIVKSRSRIRSLENNKNLDNLYFNNIEKVFSYELIFETRVELDVVKKDIEILDEIIDFQIKYGN